MTTEARSDKSLEARLAEPFLDGIEHATSELRKIIGEARTHADNLKVFFDFAKELAAEQQESSLLREKLEQQAEYPQLKLKVATQEADLSAFASMFPAGTLKVFGIIERRSLAQPENRKILPALFAWITFESWSESREINNFVAAFRKVDTAVWETLHGDRRLDLVRAGIAEAVRESIDRTLRADFAVSWSFQNKAFDESRHHCDSGGGTTISAVRTALITRDGNIVDKALVECR